MTLPLEAVRRSLGEGTDLRALMRALQVLTGMSDGEGDEEEVGQGGNSDHYMSAGSGERTPPTMDPSEVEARVQGTPDFPHRAQDLDDAAFEQGPPGLSEEIRGVYPEASTSTDPLFGPGMRARLAQMQQGAPLLYGRPVQEPLPVRSEAPSALSSREIQAEVRRQLDDRQCAAQD